MPKRRPGCRCGGIRHAHGLLYGCHIPPTGLLVVVGARLRVLCMLVAVRRRPLLPLLLADGAHGRLQTLGQLRRCDLGAHLLQRLAE